MKVYFLLFLFYVNGLMANTYYVSENGLDSNTGLSESLAFASIQKAADLVVAGDSVLVLAGSYAGFDFRSASGDALNPIVFQAVGEVLITSSGPQRDDGINIEGPDHVIIDGFTVNNMLGSGNGIRVVLSDHVLIKNNKCDNNAERGIFTGFTDDITIEYNVCTNSVDEHGIYVSNSSDRPIIRYNECYGNNNIGIHMNGDLSAGGDGIISDAQVYGNIIHDNNLAAGINMDGCLRPIVYNNLIYNNHTSQGIALFQGDGAIPTREAQIYNNTIIVPNDGRWGILVNTGSHEGTKIFNNIIINNHLSRGSIATESIFNGFESDYNLLSDKVSFTGDGSSVTLTQWQNVGLGLNSHVAAAETDLFVDPFAINPIFALKAQSQALDAGSPVVNPPVSMDIVGMTRPQNQGYDVGAYEKIYCPKSRTLSGVDEPLTGFYFAQDTIYLSGILEINTDVSLRATTIENMGNLNILSGATATIQKDGCVEE
jgi:parallel beta-helix repeat protein